MREDIALEGDVVCRLDVDRRWMAMDQDRKLI